MPGWRACLALLRHAPHSLLRATRAAQRKTISPTAITLFAAARLNMAARTAGKAAWTTADGGVNAATRTLSYRYIISFS